MEPTSLISKDSNANAGNGNSSTPSISGDGRFVAFTSLATNLGYGWRQRAANLSPRPEHGRQWTNSLISQTTTGRRFRQRCERVRLDQFRWSIRRLHIAGDQLAARIPAVAGSRSTVTIVQGERHDQSRLQRQQRTPGTPGTVAAIRPRSTATADSWPFPRRRPIWSLAAVGSSDIYVRALP